MGITGDGSDQLMVNGRKVCYQGIAHLRKDFTTAQAQQEMNADGYKKYFLESLDGQERIVVKADHLDFSYLKTASVPNVTVNGKPYRMVSQDRQDSTLLEYVRSGVKTGIGVVARETINGGAGLAKSLSAAGAVAAGVGVAYSLITRQAIGSLLLTFGTAAIKPICLLVGVALLVGAVGGGVYGFAQYRRRGESTAWADCTEPSSAGPNPNPAKPGVSGLAANAPAPAPAADNGGQKEQSSDTPDWNNLPPVGPHGPDVDEQAVNVAKLGPALKLLERLQHH